MNHHDLSCIHVEFARTSVTDLSRQDAANEVSADAFEQRYGTVWPVVFPRLGEGCVQRERRLWRFQITLQAPNAIHETFDL